VVSARRVSGHLGLPVDCATGTIRVRWARGWMERVSRVFTCSSILLQVSPSRSVMVCSS
jgi:hypothetical protein